VWRQFIRSLGQFDARFSYVKRARRWRPRAPECRLGDVGQTYISRRRLPVTHFITVIRWKTGSSVRVQVRNGIKVMASLSEPSLHRPGGRARNPHSTRPIHSISRSKSHDLLLRSNGHWSRPRPQRLIPKRFTTQYATRWSRTCSRWRFPSYTVWNQNWIYNGGADTMPVTHAGVSRVLLVFRSQLQSDALYTDVFIPGLWPLTLPNEKYGHRISNGAAEWSIRR